METHTNGALPNAQRAKSILLIFYILAGLIVGTIIITLTIFRLPDYLQMSGELADAKNLLLYVFPTLVGLFRMLAFILAVVFFILWSRRAYANLERMGRDIIFQEGWAAAAWFVPFINLVRPYNIMVEVWEDYQRLLAQVLDQDPQNFQLQSNSKLTGWWTFWILSNVVNSISNLRVIESDWDLTLNISLVADVFLLISLGLLIQAIRQISSWEAEVQAVYNIMDIEGERQEEESLY